MKKVFLAGLALISFYAVFAVAQPIRQSNPSLSSGVDASLGNVTASGTISAKHFVASNTITDLGSLSVTGAGGITSTYGVSAATGVIGTGALASTATFQVNGALGVNAGAYFGGSVGVGTTNPGAKLEVAGGVLYASTPSVRGQDVALFGSDSTTPGNSVAIRSIGTNAGDYPVNTVATYNGVLNVGAQATNGNRSIYARGGALLATDLGNVGIGNTAPIQKLDVTGNITNSGVIHSSGTGTNILTGDLAFVGDTGITLTTADGSDDSYLYLGGGGAIGNNRGGAVQLFGNEDSGAGDVIIEAGNVSGGDIIFKESGAVGMTLLDGGDLVTGAHGFKSTFTATTGGLALSGPLTSASYIQIASKTVAQLEAITPTATGQQYYCSDCLNGDFAVISTGTAVCQFAAMGPSAAWH